MRQSPSFCSSAIPSGSGSPVQKPSSPQRSCEQGLSSLHSESTVHGVGPLAPPPPSSSPHENDASKSALVTPATTDLAARTARNDGAPSGPANEVQAVRRRETTRKF